ncbi:MAG TPA: methionine adenosyltransferase domain-containing protein, partial [Candidatus Avelusimicrobium excrementipullorum]|nr:methionine adenosyltransferase domain-containing protein [Candidatus Avelusimicrobium excrementipullorum]
DPTKVDRSAAYMARYIAKNIVAAKLAKECTVQIAYAIGKEDPVGFYVDTDGTGKIPDEKLADIARKIFPMTPKGIIEHFKLRNPIYLQTAAGGHFGRKEFPWEATDKVKALQAAAAK